MKATDSQLKLEGSETDTFTGRGQDSKGIVGVFFLLHKNAELAKVSVRVAQDVGRQSS